MMECLQPTARIRNGHRGMASRSVAVAEDLGSEAVLDSRQPALLDALGGESSVQRIVDRLAARLLDDPLLATALAGVDVAQLKRTQARFFTEAFDAVRVHDPPMPFTVRVTGEQFTRVVLHVQQTLESLGLPEDRTEQLMLAVLARAVSSETTRPASPAGGTTRDPGASKS